MTQSNEDLRPSFFVPTRDYTIPPAPSTNLPLNPCLPGGGGVY
jgi:hypothetical protein